MTDHPDLRAADADRERVVELLREHCAAGRLTTDELAERIDQAFAARTLGELEAPLRELPAAPTPPPPARDSAGTRRRAWPPELAPLASLLPLALLFIVIWAATGAGYFWPIWPILGIAFARLPGTRCGHRSRSAAHDPRRAG
jgi:hypothetical protein